MLRPKKHSHSQTVGVRIGDMVGTDRTSYTLEDVARLRMCDCSNKVCLVGGSRFAMSCLIRAVLVTSSSHPGHVDSCGMSIPKLNS